MLPELYARLSSEYGMDIENARRLVLEKLGDRLDLGDQFILPGEEETPQEPTWHELPADPEMIAKINGYIEALAADPNLTEFFTYLGMEAGKARRVKDEFLEELGIESLEELTNAQAAALVDILDKIPADTWVYNLKWQFTETAGFSWPVAMVIIGTSLGGITYGMKLMYHTYGPEKAVAAFKKITEPGLGILPSPKWAASAEKPSLWRLWWDRLRGGPAAAGLRIVPGGNITNQQLRAAQEVLAGRTTTPNIMATSRGGGLAALRAQVRASEEIIRKAKLEGTPIPPPDTVLAGWRNIRNKEGYSSIIPFVPARERAAFNRYVFGSEAATPTWATQLSRQPTLTSRASAFLGRHPGLTAAAMIPLTVGAALLAQQVPSSREMYESIIGRPLNAVEEEMLQSQGFLSLTPEYQELLRQAYERQGIAASLQPPGEAFPGAEHLWQQLTTQPFSRTPLTQWQIEEPFGEEEELEIQELLPAAPAVTQRPQSFRPSLPFVIRRFQHR